MNRIKSAKLVGLRVTNYMRVRSAEISLNQDGGVTIISGRNGQGKTTLVDAIWDTLTGEKKPRPVTVGEDTGSLEIELLVEGESGESGTILVRRVLRVQSDGTTSATLKVSSTGGYVFSKPQTLLRSLLSAVCVDPLEWSEAGLSGAEGRRKQARDLLAVAGATLPQRGIDVLRKHKMPVPDPGGDPMGSVVLARAYIAEQRKLAKAAIDKIATSALMDIGGPNGLEEVNATTKFAEHIEPYEELEKRRLDAYDRLVFIRDTKAKLAAASRNVETCRQSIKTFEQLLYDLRETLRGLEDEEASLNKETQDLEDTGYCELDLMALIDRIAEDEKNLSRAGHAKARLAKYEEARRTATELALEQLSWDEDAKALDESVKEMISAVRFETPLGTLNYEDIEDRLTLDGIPFPEQVSGAARIAAGAAVAIASQPKLGLFRVRHGNDLDTESIKALDEFSKKHGVTVLVEMVDESEQFGLVVEDGQIVADNRKKETLEV